VVTNSVTATNMPATAAPIPAATNILITPAARPPATNK
jgi:hypothetical protein